MSSLNSFTQPLSWWGPTKTGREYWRSYLSSLGKWYASLGLICLRITSGSLGQKSSQSSLMINCPILAKFRAPEGLQLIPRFLKRLARILSILPSMAPMVSTGNPAALRRSTALIPSELLMR